MWPGPKLLGSTLQKLEASSTLGSGLIFLVNQIFRAKQFVNPLKQLLDVIVQDEWVITHLFGEAGFVIWSRVASWQPPSHRNNTVHKRKQLLSTIQQSQRSHPPNNYGSGDIHIFLFLDLVVSCMRWFSLFVSLRYWWISLVSAQFLWHV